MDASTKGLGATLMEQGKPIAFASKALTDTESHYANIECELLTVVYGCERFHSFLYGQTFIAESDHKPLESIQLKHLTSSPPRLQRMLLRRQPYDLTIRYRLGTQIQIADALSRLVTRRESTNSCFVCADSWSLSSILQQIPREDSVRNQQDPELVALKEVVYTGWPATIKQLPSVVRPYWTFWDELAIEDSLLLKGHRIITPQSFQSEIPVKLHTSHQRTEKTKLSARTSVFWRNLNRDIDDLTHSCAVCQEFQSKQSKEPLIPTEVPARPWHTVGTVLFLFDDDEYLIITDYYSKYPFLRKIPRGQSNSKTVVNLT